jgi:hypothetical protein
MDTILEAFEEPVLSFSDFFEEVMNSLSSGNYLVHEVKCLSRLMALPEPPAEGELSACVQSVGHSEEAWDQLELEYTRITSTRNQSGATQKVVEMRKVRSPRRR